MIHLSLEAGVKLPSAAMWSYSSVALVLGRSQKPGAAVLGRAGEEGIDVVVRSSGGGAVIAGPWLTLDVLFVWSAMIADWTVRMGLLLWRYRSERWKAIQVFR